MWKTCGACSVTFLRCSCSRSERADRQRRGRPDTTSRRRSPRSLGARRLVPWPPTTQRGDDAPRAPSRLEPIRVPSPDRGPRRGLLVVVLLERPGGRIARLADRHVIRRPDRRQRGRQHGAPVGRRRDGAVDGRRGRRRDRSRGRPDGRVREWRLSLRRRGRHPLRHRGRLGRRDVDVPERHDVLGKSLLRGAHLERRGGKRPRPRSRPPLLDHRLDPLRSPASTPSLPTAAPQRS